MLFLKQKLFQTGGKLTNLQMLDNSFRWADDSHKARTWKEEKMPCIFKQLSNKILLCLISSFWYSHSGYNNFLIFSRLMFNILKKS